METMKRLTVEADETIAAATWGYTSLASTLIGTAKGRIVTLAAAGAEPGGDR